MSKNTGIYVAIVSAVSLLFAVLLFNRIHSRYGTWRSLLICLAGVAAIWFFGYLRARFFGWVGPTRRSDDED
jgi:hypothetical protein